MSNKRMHDVEKHIASMPKEERDQLESDVQKILELSKQLPKDCEITIVSDEEKTNK